MCDRVRRHLGSSNCPADERPVMPMSAARIPKELASYRPGCHAAAMVEPLTPESLREVLGPTQPTILGHVDVLAEVQCDGYQRRAIAYDVPSGRASAFVCIPDGATQRVPIIFCHHQHASQFDLGKSEAVGLRGVP